MAKKKTKTKTKTKTKPDNVKALKAAGVIARKAKLTAADKKVINGLSPVEVLVLKNVKDQLGGTTGIEFDGGGGGIF